MKIRCRGQSDVGVRRERNEDSLLIDESLGLFVVADGMGGHAGGDIASQLAVATVAAVVREASAQPEGPFAANVPLPESPLPDLMREAVEAAGAVIHSRALDEPDLAGMGTTVTALLLRETDAFFAHVGDSRAYLVRGELIQQISEDHSFVNEQVKAGVLTTEEARTSRYKNIITRSVGYELGVTVDLMGILAEPGDLFVLCSDGLSNLVEDEEIREAAHAVAVEELPDRLIAMANERGGDDNITVIAIRLEA